MTSPTGSPPPEARPPKPHQSLFNRILRHPVLMLGGVSAAALPLSLLQFAVAVAVLSPADFAVVGVLLAAGSFVANFVDLRLIDLSTKLYYEASKHQPGARLSILRAGFWLQGGLAMLAFALAAPVTTYAAAWLLERPVEWSWIWIAAFLPAAAFVSSTVSAFLRTTGAFEAFGAFRLSSQILQAVIVITFLVIGRNVGSYLTGLGLAALVVLALSILWCEWESRKRLGGSLLAFPDREAVQQHLGDLSFLAAGSLIGFAKMMSRTGDVLMVAALSSDDMTGLYRVARQAADALYSLTDAVNQFYGPTIIAAVSRKDDAAFRHLRKRVFGIGLATVAAAVLVGLFVLPPVTTWYAPQHLGAVAPFTVFAAAIMVLIGVHSWLWPALVAQGTISRFGLASLAGAALQILAMAVLYRLDLFTPTTAAMCFWLCLGVTYAPFVLERIIRRISAR
jgi:O-antigen/teichoic acid export membrane protein